MADKKMVGNDDGGNILDMIYKEKDNGLFVKEMKDVAGDIKDDLYNRYAECVEFHTEDKGEHIEITGESNDGVMFAILIRIEDKNAKLPELSKEAALKAASAAVNKLR